MIFLTVGSHEPFDRLVVALDEWAARNPTETVFGQITNAGSFRPAHFRWEANLNPDRYEAAVSRSTILVGHAGMGSIITALEFGRRIVILPRRGYLGESRNDHQWDTARRFEGRSGILVARETADLPAAMALALDTARNGAAGTRGGQARLGHGLAEERLIRFLRGVVAC